MITLPLAVPIVKPVNPRDGWPAWTDEQRWGLGPDAGQVVDDEPRPTAGPEFQPTPDDDAAWLTLKLALASGSEAPDDDAMHAERMETAFANPLDSVPYDELVRGLGHRAYDYDPDRVVTFPGCFIDLYPRVSPVSEGGVS